MDNLLGFLVSLSLSSHDVMLQLCRHVFFLQSMENEMGACSTGQPVRKKNLVCSEVRKTARS
jgi:hypothetical protein